MKRFFVKADGGFKWAMLIPMVLGGIALAVLFAFLFGWIVMLLWNWLMPEIFGLTVISYWQAWGLVLLSHILIKPGYGGHGEGGGKKKKNANGLEAQFKFERMEPEAASQEPQGDDDMS
ncbi:MAG TPA: hypothetical protein DCG47_10405 [Spirochaetaceae bacterium]|jgi:hypothetical protein|nr:hypothetical protein [Spirochaetaceae bacterium]